MNKVGFDIHGCIDKYSDQFGSMGHSFMDSDIEVHIITGAKYTTKLEDLLQKNGMFKGINYTHFFSITDYHISQSNQVDYDEDGNPWIDEEMWNKTKAIYCSKNSIDLMFDDSEIYGKYFNTTQTMYCQLK